MKISRTLVAASSLLATLSLGARSFAQTSTTATSSETKDEPNNEGWLFNVELAGGAPLNGAHDQEYDLGGGATAGLYHSIIPKLSLGANLSAGALGGDPSVGGDGVENEDFGIGMLNASVRFQPLASPDESMAHGLWLELAGGGGIIDGELSPTLAPGVGYNFGLEGVSLGPSLRYVQAINDEARFDGEDARIAMFGLQLSLDAPNQLSADQTERGVEMVPAAGPYSRRDSAEQDLERPEDRYVPGESTPHPAFIDKDGDGITDNIDQCQAQPETKNGVNDHDGCPDTSAVVFINNQVLFDEAVFFDYDSSALKLNGKTMLGHIAHLYRQTGDQWQTLVISGHADQRGPAPYNQELSRERAQKVADHLVQLGVPGDLIDTRAYGERQPLIANPESASERAINRRVGFEIIWK